MPDKSEPLVVRPRQARAILQIGKTLFYQMLKDSRLERVQLGRWAIGVTMASIRRVAENRGPSPEPRPPTPRVARPRS